MKLLLFDIDGTLLHVNGAGREAVVRALSTVSDRPVSVESVPFSGRTDPAIFEEALTQNGLPTTEEMLEEVLDVYVNILQGSLSSAEVEVLPGVRSLLSRLHDRSDVSLGLLTGNVEPAAYQKLSVPGLSRYFSFGAFGSDHADRNQLPPIATRRASTHTGHSFRCGDHLTIIGDTPHDIRCAQAVGAHSVAVCTGRYTRAELLAQAPNVVVDTLRDTNEVLEDILTRSFEA